MSSSTTPKALRRRSVEAFLKNDLYNPERQILGQNRSYCNKHCKAVKPGAPPAGAARQGARGQTQYSGDPRGAGATRALGIRPAPGGVNPAACPYCHPLIWILDGYPAVRATVCDALASHNPISLAGDTHNGWEPDQSKGQAVGVEWGANCLKPRA